MALLPSALLFAIAFGMASGATAPTARSVTSSHHTLRPPGISGTNNRMKLTRRNQVSLPTRQIYGVTHLSRSSPDRAQTGIEALVGTHPISVALLSMMFLLFSAFISTLRSMQCKASLGPNAYSLVTLTSTSDVLPVTEVAASAVPEDVIQRIRAAVPVDAKGRPSKDDVERISQGRAARRRGTGSRAVAHRLNADEREEWQRTQRRGYLEVVGSGFRRGGRDYSPDRVGNPLVNIFRQWCDATCRPSIVVRKATSAGQGDSVVIDASPLRMSDPKEYAAFFDACDAIAARLSCDRLSAPSLTEDSAQAWLDGQDMQDGAVWRLPTISVEYNCGTRQQAKGLARQLLSVWDRLL
jgi:hypothetical protein